MNHVADAVSDAAFKQHRNAPELLSAETLPEISGLIDFQTFAQEYPEKLFPLVARLRPEFQELFVEYYILSKSQSFIGKVHGQIQTRIWQKLRIIEKNIGAFIILGASPSAVILRPIIEAAGVEKTELGSLTDMIVLYARTQSYAAVAEKFKVPIPAVRKVFRPVIKKLMMDEDVKAVAVGAYLRGLTHQSSLGGTGHSKSYVARLQRIKIQKFDAPPSDKSPLISFGRVDSLQETPWCMLEISSDQRMTQIYPVLCETGKKIFGNLPAQIFAPANESGELVFGYIFARCKSTSKVRSLTKIRGIMEMSTLCDDEGKFIEAVKVPHSDIKKMMAQYPTPEMPDIRTQDFVEILTGPAAHYCGTVTKINTITDSLRVEVNFPTGRQFIVTADPSCVKLLPKIPIARRAFWGILID